MLFNEPKLLKLYGDMLARPEFTRFSALQRAEIAEICWRRCVLGWLARVSVLFNEPKLLKSWLPPVFVCVDESVSVLFNEPKLLKFIEAFCRCDTNRGFSALQRAEIAEMLGACGGLSLFQQFQCSSTSRNC